MCQSVSVSAFAAAKVDTIERLESSGADVELIVALTPIVIVA